MLDEATVEARSAIEALRSGVPSRPAVAQLGTTQSAAQEAFERALDDTAAGAGTRPLTISATFGGGKTHLLEWFRTRAEQRGFVTAYLVLSPETPLGRPETVLRAIAEDARAPGRTGPAIRELAAAARADGAAWEDLRRWAAVLPDRFQALLHIYEAIHIDEELRAAILADFEGRALSKTVIRQKLKELGQQAAYDLSGPTGDAALAPARLRLFGRLCRAFTGRGLVVLIDETERLRRFTVRQRLAAYDQLGWWRQQAETEDSGLLPVLAMTSGFVEETISGGTSDAGRVRALEDNIGSLARQGIDWLQSAPLRLQAPTSAEEAEIQYRVKAIYERAYGRAVPAVAAGQDVRTSLRAEIRRWITCWDLMRYHPGYCPRLQSEAVTFDEREISDDLRGEEDA
jgi:hypothetical protein